MSFLEILRCVLCCVEDYRDENDCVEDYRDENDNETLLINTSGERRLPRRINPFNFKAIFGSRSSDSANNGSTYVNSVERTYSVSSSSDSYNKYAHIYFHEPEISSSWLPPSSSKKATFSSSPTPSRASSSLTTDTAYSKTSLLSPASSTSSQSSKTSTPELPLPSNHAQPLKPEISSSKPSLLSPASSTSYQSSKTWTPKLPLPSNHAQPLKPEISSSKSSLVSPASSTSSQSSKTWTPKLPLPSNHAQPLKPEISSSKSSLVSPASSTSSQSSKTWTSKLPLPSNHAQPLKPEISSSKPSLLSPASSTSSQSSKTWTPKLPLPSNHAQPLKPEISSSKSSLVSPASSTSSQSSKTWTPKLPLPSNHAQPLKPEISSSKPSLLSPASSTSSQSSKTWTPKLPLPSNHAQPLKPEISSSKPSLLSPASSTSSQSSKTWTPKLPLPSNHAQPLKPEISSSKPFPVPLPSFKPILIPDYSNITGQKTKANNVFVQKDDAPIYMIPKDIQDLIKKDMVPGVLKIPVSMSTYKDHFAALLYAEDFYIEKWSEFNLVDISLKLEKASVFKLSYFKESHEKDDKIFMTFEIDSCRERRPFLLSRDFVFARPSGRETEPFQGVIYRVVRSTTVLVEFGDDFYAQHHSSRKYDVSFSFNRVCLKRAHQAIEAASDSLFRSYTFPDCDFRKRDSASSPPYFNYELDADQASAVRQILSFQGSPPYLIKGPLCVTKARNGIRQLSKTGLVVQEAVSEIYRSSQKHRVLICGPINNTCDLLTRSLMKHIPESDMFRANAAFREIDGVPIDILSSCTYKGECFSCPRLQQLRKFRVILSTYISSYRLCNEGIAAGHFSHIFLVDASSATEPEAMVALANLANENTAVIVTGAPGNSPGWVRSDIARKNGLMTSYFKRLRRRSPYNILDPMFITELVSLETKTDDKHSFQSFSFM